MSLFGPKPERPPVALPSPDGGTVELVLGANVVRRPIFQSLVSIPNWHMEMAGRIAAAKCLGFTMFEIDITNVQTREEKQADGIYFGIIGWSTPIEGEEWKGEDNKKKLVKNQVVTVYALVVE